MVYYAYVVAVAAASFVCNARNNNSEQLPKGVLLYILLCSNLALLSVGQRAEPRGRMVRRKTLDVEHHLSRQKLGLVILGLM